MFPGSQTSHGGPPYSPACFTLHSALFPAAGPPRVGKACRKPVPPGASGTPPGPRRPQELLSLSASSLGRASEGSQTGGWQSGAVLCWSQWLCHIPCPSTVILSAEALALRRARQARRRAQCAPMLLSKEQKELVRTLLGAHTRHMGAMFDQFVQFRVSTHRIWVGM